MSDTQMGPFERWLRDDYWEEFLPDRIEGTNLLRKAQEIDRSRAALEAANTALRERMQQVQRVAEGAVKAATEPANQLLAGYELYGAMQAVEIIARVASDAALKQAQQEIRQ